MISARLSLLLPVCVLAAAACGGGPAAHAPGPDLGAPSVPFRHKTRDEKRAFMAARVQPKMRQVFQAFNSKSYEGFGCETCHGADMEAVDFRMPNSLYALPEKDTLAGAAEYDEKTTRFMSEHVVPAFAALLSEKAGTPDHAGPGTVTCFTCHPHE